MKVEMYGSPICCECVSAKEVISKQKDIQLNYHNITETTSEMKAFLKIRDQEKMFDDIKKKGGIGIPFFILEDGTMTFEVTDFCTVEITNDMKPKNACSLDGKGNC